VRHRTVFTPGSGTDLEVSIRETGIQSSALTVRDIMIRSCIFPVLNHTSSPTAAEPTLPPSLGMAYYRTAEHYALLCEQARMRALT
jgi:hypothetical protein